MIVVNIDIVLKAYNAVLNNKLSYPEADRWAWDMMQQFDDGSLVFEPVKDEELIWMLIQFLYGLNLPDVNDKMQFARSNTDLINFLKKNNVYEKVIEFNEP